MYRAEVLNQLGRFSEALADVERSLQFAPDDDEVLFGVSLIELLHGRWREAWPKYERRIALRVGIPEGFCPPAWPIWRGESLKDELLVLRCEQSFGDHLQFSGLAVHLAKLGYRVALWTNSALQPLLQSVPGVECVISDANTLEGVEKIRWIPIISVLGILGITPETVPQNTPFLAAEPGRVAAWRERLGTHGFKIGISWQGSAVNSRRSIPLGEFAMLCDIPGVRLISLQKGLGVEQIPTVEFSDRIETLGPKFDEGGGAFLDSAAVTMNLDLVITCDTALVHLAGGLGRPTFLGLMHIPEWRWLLDRDDCLWYPTVRLFRQASAGDWRGVFARIVSKVSELAERP